MGKYVKIQEEVEAVQATSDNLEELRRIGGAVRKVQPTKERVVYYTIPGVNVVLWEGSWLIKHESGRLEVKSNWMFHMEYEPK